MNDFDRFGAHEIVGLVAALAAADQAGVIEALCVEATDERAIVKATGCDPVALDRVLGVMAAVGLVTRGPGGVVRMDEALLKEAGAGSGPTALLSLYRDVGAFLKTGERRLRARESLHRLESIAEEHEELFGAPARALAAQLEPRARILDVGVGTGVWSLAMLERTSGSGIPATVVGFDRPDVTPVFLAEARRRGLEERVIAVAGNYHEDELPSGHDRVLVASVLHLETAEGARRLIAKAKRACRPGGEVVVVDEFPVGPERPLAHAVQELALAMRTSTGRAHPAEAIAEWMEQAGLEVMPPLSLATSSLNGLGALTGIRRA